MPGAGGRFVPALAGGNGTIDVDLLAHHEIHPLLADRDDHVGIVLIDDGLEALVDLRRRLPAVNEIARFFHRRRGVARPEKLRRGVLPEDAKGAEQDGQERFEITSESHATEKMLLFHTEATARRQSHKSRPTRKPLAESFGRERVFKATLAPPCPSPTPVCP